MSSLAWTWCLYSASCTSLCGIEPKVLARSNRSTTRLILSSFASLRTCVTMLVCPRWPGTRDMPFCTKVYIYINSWERTPPAVLLLCWRTSCLQHLVASSEMIMNWLIVLESFCFGFHTPSANRHCCTVFPLLKMTLKIFTADVVAGDNTFIPCKMFSLVLVLT